MSVPPAFADDTRDDRCTWATGEHLTPYHDTEWGVFTMDDRAHFEHLSLEGFQSGLSWTTILKKRAHLNTLFADFNPAAVAEFTDDAIEKILQDTGGIRNRRKVSSVVKQRPEGARDHRAGGLLRRLPLRRLRGRGVGQPLHERLGDSPPHRKIGESRENPQEGGLFLRRPPPPSTPTSSPWDSSTITW